MVVFHVTLDVLYLKRNLERCGRGLILEKWSVLHATNACEDRYYASTKKMGVERATGSGGCNSINDGKQNLFYCYSRKPIKRYLV